ncbi:MAG TPA: monovalent cation/H(+) antiporter subunit G [Streptosporangiaceae bacterium]|nr:monovalent cation/H(+) antiporter subunit G [Streptosporangiaceae bacterium]
MTARTIVADVLLGAAVLVVLGASAGILLMRDVYQKVHYVTLAGLIAPVIVGVAILIQSGWSVNSMQTWLAIALMVIATPFLSHATIRAARIRQAGDWTHGDDRNHTDHEDAEAKRR